MTCTENMKPYTGTGCKVRTLSEILKDADDAKELNELIELWNEVANNKYKFPLIQIRFANEHIRELALKSNGTDIERGKFYLALKEMDLQSSK